MADEALKNSADWARMARESTFAPGACAIIAGSHAYQEGQSADDCPFDAEADPLRFDNWHVGFRKAELSAQRGPKGARRRSTHASHSAAALEREE